MTALRRLIDRRPGALNELDDIMNYILRRSKTDNDLHDGAALRRDEEMGRGNNLVKARARTGEPARQTVVEVVYKTLPATFEGPIAGYSTLEWDPQPTPSADSPEQSQLPQPTPTRHADTPSNQALESTPKAIPAQSAPTSQETSKSETNKSSSRSEMDKNIPTMISPPSSAQAVDSVLAQATGLPSPAPTLAADHNSLASSTKSSGILATQSASAANMTSSPSANTDSGTSAGVKAGIAFGVLGGVFIVGLIAILLFRRRKSSHRQRLDDDEKYSGFGGAMGAQEFLQTGRESNPLAPRISLRPVTQFLPNWNLEKHASREPDGALTPGPATSSIYSDRPITTHSTRSVNPFGNHAERAPSPIREEDELSFKGIPPPKPALTIETRTIQGSQIDNAAAAATNGPMKRMTSMTRGQKDLTTSSTLAPIAASPAITEGSVYSTGFGPPPSPTMGAAAIAAAGGPANSTIHRVQLAFKPTLEDEMELKTGELIRLLHEYDDGWALVIRLDRSQQGVVPRTCFSARPVKPLHQQSRLPVTPIGGIPRPPVSPVSPTTLPTQGKQSTGLPPAARPHPRLHGLPPITSPTLPVGQPASPFGLPSLLSPGPPPALPSAAPQPESLARKPAPGQAF